jgi:hypothetical protein
MVVVNNGIFNMNGNSRITEHVSSSNGGAVEINHENAVINMSGTSSITGNRATTPATSSAAVGGLRIIRGTLNMSGESSITGNRHGTAADAPLADLLVNRPTDDTDARFNINENPKLGVVILHAIQGSNSSINVGADFDGSIDTIHLRGADTDASTVMNLWTDKTVLTGDGAADAVANVTLGNFRTTNSATAGVITETHEIDDTGVLRRNPSSQPFTFVISPLPGTPPEITSGITLSRSGAGSNQTTETLTITNADDYTNIRWLFGINDTVLETGPTIDLDLDSVTPGQSYNIIGTQRIFVEAWQGGVYFGTTVVFEVVP